MQVAAYWRTGPERMRMVGEMCDNCGKKIFPPRDVCPDCGHETRVNLSDIMEADGLWTGDKGTKIPDNDIVAIRLKLQGMALS